MNLSIQKTNTLEIKAIGILMVIISHLGSIYGSSIISNIGSFGVALFLFISGYGLVKSYNKNGLRGFFKKRLLTVLLPYSLITIVWIIIDLIKGFRYSIKTYVLLLLGFDYNRTIDPTMWYISFIILWYIAFYFIYKIFKNDIFRVILLFLVALMFFKFSETGRIIKLSWQWHFHAFTFPIGIAVGTFLKDGISRVKGKLIFILSFLFIIIFFNKIETNVSIYMVMNLVVAIFVILALLIKDIKLKPFKSLSFIGIYSYELYLVEGYLTRIFHYLDNKTISLIIYLISLVFWSYILKKIFSLKFKNKKIGENKKLINKIKREEYEYKNS